MEVCYIETGVLESLLDRFGNLATHVEHLCKKMEEKKLGD